MEIIEWIKSLLVDYGAVNVIIMLLTILITNLIKKPIVNKADKFVTTAKKLTGLEVDKSVITSNIIYIPVGVSFVLYFIYLVAINKFDFAAISWTQLVSDSVVYGMLSMSIYEIGKAKIKSFVSKKTYNDAKQQIEEIQAAEKSGDLLVAETTETQTETSDIQEAQTNIIKENK